MKRQKKNFKKVILSAILIMPLLTLLLLGNFSGAQAKTQDTYKNLEIFSNVLSIIQKSYVENVDTSKVLQGAIKGMLASLDPHSSYMKPDDFKELRLETKGSFTGIGIEITTRDGILTVVSPIEGTPGYKKGMKAGDKIIKIEGESTQDLSLMEAVKKLRGPKGSKVTISIHRKGWTELKKITITRNVIPLHSIKAKMIETGYPYLRITSFQSKTTHDFKEELQKLASKGEIKGLIIDLRNNPGGLLAQAVKISDIFIDDGVIVSTKGRVENQNTIYKAHSGGIDHNYPIAILVNGGSASASEIVSGALQDHKKAIIIGTQTFGKGSVQTIIPMSNGAGLRLTTARYYTPSGISIQAKGITPDIIVENVPIAEDYDSNAKKPKHLREKDLKKHLVNSDTTPVKEEKKIQESIKEDDIKEKKETEKEREGKIKSLLDRDMQLHTALTLLKGLNVFDGFHKVAQK